ncbi:MAG: hypothetical protein ACM3O7_11470 [Acidobacteriota bacterium]
MLRGEIGSSGGRVRFAGLLVAAAVAVWLASTSAAGAPTSVLLSVSRPVPRPSVDSSVTAGAIVTVDWPLLSTDVDEFELLLSLDGGHSYPVRLTPQLDPGTTVLTWKVPNLPTPAARLRLRVGVAGREVDGEPSREFRLLPRSGLPPTPLWYAGGEWWTSVAASLGPVEVTQRTATVQRSVIAALDPFPAVTSTSEPLPPPAATTSPPVAHLDRATASHPVVAFRLNPHSLPQRE